MYVEAIKMQQLVITFESTLQDEAAPGADVQNL